MVKGKKTAEAADDEWEDLRMQCHQLSIEPSDLELTLLKISTKFCKVCPAQGCDHAASTKQNLMTHITSQHPGVELQDISMNSLAMIQFALNMAEKVKKARTNAVQHEIASLQQPSSTGPSDYYAPGGGSQLTGLPTLAAVGGGYAGPVVKSYGDQQASATMAFQGSHQYDNYGGIGASPPSQSVFPHPFTSAGFVSTSAHSQQMSGLSATFGDSGHPVPLNDQVTQSCSHEVWSGDFDEAE